MRILFCDLCNESVPQSDFRGGRAVELKGRVICANCEAAMSTHPEGSGAPSLRASGSGASLSIPDAPPARAEAPVSDKVAVRATGVADDTTIVESGDPVFAPGTVGAHPAGGSASGAVGVALGAVALLFSAGTAAFLFDHLETRHQELQRGIEQAGVAARTGVSEVEGRLSRELRETSEALVEARASLGDLRQRFDAAESGRRESLSGLREDLSLVLERTRELDRIAAATGRHDEELLRLGETVDVLHQELLGFGDRLHESALQPAEPILSANAADEPEEPDWTPIVEDLSSQSSGDRWQAVQSLGATRDAAVAEHLAPMLKDPDIFVRMATARILGDLEAVIGIPALIDALEDPEASVREASVVALRSITGRDFDFDPGAKDAERSRRVKAWRDWWRKAAEDYLGADE